MKFHVAEPSRVQTFLERLVMSKQEEGEGD